jgi:DNA (cytosine-5)-methyltransferase 1
MKRKIHTIESYSKKTKLLQSNDTYEKIRFIDMFSGIGGFHLGIRKFNAVCLMACDIDMDCNKIYEINYKIKPKGDISKIEIGEIPDHDILFAGFPCQVS